MNLVDDIIKSSKQHQLVDDKASDLNGQQWTQLTAPLQRNVDLFLCPGQT